MDSDAQINQQIKNAAIVSAHKQIADVLKLARKNGVRITKAEVRQALADQRAREVEAGNKIQALVAQAVPSFLKNGKGIVAPPTPLPPEPLLPSRNPLDIPRREFLPDLTTVIVLVNANFMKADIPLDNLRAV